MSSSGPPPRNLYALSQFVPFTPRRSPRASSSKQHSLQRAPQPSASLGSLPVELINKIAELCHEQDEQFERWLERTHEESTGFARRVGAAGRSLNALFMTSKTLASVAAPWVFKASRSLLFPSLRRRRSLFVCLQVLRTSKIDMRFKLAVAPGRLGLFRKLHLDPVGAEAGYDFIPFVPALRGVKSVVFGRKAIERLWGLRPATVVPRANMDYTSRAVSTAFQSLSFAEFRISSASTDTVRLGNVFPLATFSAPTLQRLSIGMASTNLDALGDFIIALRSLVHLELFDSSPQSNRAVFNLTAVTKQLRGRAQLRSLTLGPTHLHQSHLAFAASFSSTLETLCLAATYYDPQIMFHPSQPVFAAEVFPRVTRLAILGAPHLVDKTISSATPSCFPSLLNLAVQRPILDPSKRVPPPSQSAYFEACAARGWGLEFEDAPSFARFSLRGMEGQGSFRDELRKTLEYARDRLPSLSQAEQIALDNALRVFEVVRRREIWQEVTRRVWAAL
ncbi:hypothetical protein JCM8097_007279 [Rhodosporidiobolus ruineniae]